MEEINSLKILFLLDRDFDQFRSRWLKVFKNTIMSKNRERGISSVTGSSDNPFSRFSQEASPHWRSKPPARILFSRNTLSSVPPSFSHSSRTFPPKRLVCAYGSLFAYSSHVHRKARLNLSHGQCNIERNLISPFNLLLLYNGIASASSLFWISRISFSHFS